MRKRRIVLAGIILTMALAGCGKKDVATQGITEPEAGQQTEASKEEMPEQGSAAAESLEDTVAIQPDIIVNVYPDEEGKAISPYIYGVNAGVDLSSVSAGSLRLGGNRMTAYNWENNVSNAGSDWYNSSDMYMVQDIPKNLASQPGAVALNVSAEAMEYQVPYALLTLPMLGYVANESSGYLGEEEAAPSAYWCQVLNRKEGEYTLEPDTQDGVVYNDEYLHYLFEKIGDSGSASGFKGYALDNEPALWNATHSLAQREKLTCTELLEKTTDLALVIKEMDPGADVFGPALYGYYAFLCLQDAPDWREIQAENGYRWFIDYYLDTMEEKEQEYGCRLLDVLDLHFYSEARGACGERLCEHYEEDACIKARIDSVRSLWDGDYKEDSWIMDTGAKFFPLLPNVQQSIDEYYPGTKIAFTEYDFGGGDHISGGVAQADFLGTLANHEVYLATLWS
ncbi:MAG: glycoside hydrolase family 44 protein, partial [Lachnospiraceae bacterium]